MVHARAHSCCCSCAYDPRAQHRFGIRIFVASAQPISEDAGSSAWVYHSILAMKDSDLDWMKPGAAAAEAAKKRSSDCESETTVAVENAIDFVNRHRRASALTDQYVGVCSRPLPESQVTIH